jgi:hypothetical protein
VLQRVRDTWGERGVNEAETRAELIDPALRDAGWGVVADSHPLPQAGEGKKCRALGLLPLPLAGEGWGGGGRLPDLLRPAAAIAHHAVCDAGLRNR